MKFLERFKLSQRKAANDASADFEDHKRRIAALKSEAASLADAPVPIEMAHAGVKTFLAQYDAKRLPASAFMSGDKINWPALTMGEHSLIPLLFATACRSQIEAALIGAIEVAYGETEGISPEDKRARLGAIEAELLKLEAAEELLVRASEAAGLALDRRKDATPAVVLAYDAELEAAA